MNERDTEIIGALDAMGFTEAESAACNELIDLCFDSLANGTRLVACRHDVDARKLWRLFFFLNLNAINEIDQDAAKAVQP